MKVYLTGTKRDFANSAWVSTLDEKKASQKSDEEVDRVVSFLVSEHHTTPFEVGTVSFLAESEKENLEIISFSDSCSWGKVSQIKKMAALTVDFFNFAKSCNINSCLFKSLVLEHPELESIILGQKKEIEREFCKLDYECVMKNCHVELVSVHDPFKNEEHKRITWRVEAPLSILVQLLRHRKGSFNMTSGRYRTLDAKLLEITDDIINILSKIDFDKKVGSLFSFAQQTTLKYTECMDSFKADKKEGKITNDEYKRLREFVRFALPEGRMSSLYVSFYWKDFQHYLALRDSRHAQIEHAAMAHLMEKTYNNRGSK